MSCEGTFPVGAVADAPPAIAKDTPATPNAGKDFRRRFRFEACFACAILEISYVCEKMLNEWNRTRSTNPFVNADYNMLVPQWRRHRPKANDPE